MFVTAVEGTAVDEEQLRFRHPKFSVSMGVVQSAMDENSTILAVSQGYPSDLDVSNKTFVHALMRDFRALGAKPTVIAPEPLYLLTRYPKLWGRYFNLPTADAVFEQLRVIRPRYFSFPTKRIRLLGRTDRWTTWNFRRAVMRGARTITVRPSFCYGHHIYPAGVAALRLAQHYGVPAVVGLGGPFQLYQPQWDSERIRADLSRFSRIITTSENIREACVDRYGVPADRVAVFPNGLDQDEFYPRDRVLARSNLGLPMDRLIVAFVGRLVHSKGPLRVMEAIAPYPEIGAVFVGDGPARPSGRQVLFRGAVSHHQVPTWLSAADIFVLPTVAESSCNAILEAMACGLPVVSSDIPSNREVLDPTTSILVDPLDIGQIQNAIRTLVDDPDRRRAMGSAALEKAQNFNSRERARRILEWLGQLPNEETQGERSNGQIYSTV